MDVIPQRNLQSAIKYITPVLTTNLRSRRFHQSSDPISPCRRPPCPINPAVFNPLPWQSETNNKPRETRNRSSDRRWPVAPGATSRGPETAPAGRALPAVARSEQCHRRRPADGGCSDGDSGIVGAPAPPVFSGRKRDICMGRRCIDS